jgi:HK97 family phage prohead protease
MSTTKFIDPVAFREAARAGKAAGLGVLGEAHVLKTPADGSRTVSWVLSDGSVDRSGDTISPGGWDTSAYRKNNVVLWSHDSSQPPIGRATNVRSDGARLVGDIEFAPPDVSAFADSVFRLVKGGYIKAGSVGFIPIDYAFSKDKDRPNGIDFKRQELLEFSICSVPCNANAVAEARAKGFNVSPLTATRKRPTQPRGSKEERDQLADMLEFVARLEIVESRDERDLQRALYRRRRADLIRRGYVRANV